MSPNIFEQRTTWRTPRACATMISSLTLVREQDESDDDEDDDCGWLLSAVEEQRAKKKPRKQREDAPSLPGLWEVEVLSGM